MPHSAEDMCQCLLSGIKCSDLQCRSAGDRTEDESHRYQETKRECWADGGRRGADGVLTRITSLPASHHQCRVKDDRRDLAL